MSYDETTHPPASHISPRKEGFNFLPPPPDFTLFRYEAAVDWLEVEIETETPTQPWTVADKLGIPHSKLVDDGPGHAGTIFKAKFQDPLSWAFVQKSIENSGLKLSKTPRLTQLEISFDAYPKDATRRQTNELLAHFLWFGAELRGENIRAFVEGRPEGTNDISSYNGWLRALETKTIYIGSQKRVHSRPQDPLSWRLYYKHTDAGLEIPPEQHRARIEMTLCGSALPAGTLDELAVFDLQKLTKYLKFRKLKPEIPAVLESTLAKFPLGSFQVRKRRQGGGERRFHLATAADPVLNGKAYDALRNLNRRMKRQVKGKS
ncbi:MULTISPECIES: hypothetical protein [Polaromonas]|uniref:Uncharacterized protein n=1 Tax=Polaromonas aquatica TaxID=332657 RepID=A0ABW1TYK8_9BURK